MTDWNKVKIRSSSLACLFTEPQSKADKDAGNLSKTAKSHLVEVYARELWGVERDIVTKQMKKGKEAEEESITLISRVDKTEIYQKHDGRVENDWVSGHPDILTDDTVIDIKTSWDAFTFLPKIMEDMDKTYYYQLQAYMWLTGKAKGRIAYCLVDTPDNIIQGEKYRLLRSMNVISEESPEYLSAASILESNMRFSHIPPQLRVINHYCTLDQEAIEKIPTKVEKAREFLAELHDKHGKIYVV